MSPILESMRSSVTRRRLLVASFFVVVLLALLPVFVVVGFDQSNRGPFAPPGRMSSVFTKCPLCGKDMRLTTYKSVSIFSGEDHGTELLGKLDTCFSGDRRSLYCKDCDLCFFSDSERWVQISPDIGKFKPGFPDFIAEFPTDFSDFQFYRREYLENGEFSDSVTMGGITDPGIGFSFLERYIKATEARNITGLSGRLFDADFMFELDDSFYKLQFYGPKGRKFIHIEVEQE